MALVSAKKANSESIFRHLCDQMDKLSVRAITIEEAKEQANLAKQANNVLRFELDRAKFISKFSAENIRNIEDK